MKKIQKTMTSTLMAALFLAGCASQSSPEKTSPTAEENKQVESAKNNTTSQKADTNKDEASDDSFDIEGSELAAGTVDLSKISGNAKITKAGTYKLSGALPGMLAVDAKGEDVVIELDGVSVSNSDGPALYVRKAESVTLKLSGDNVLESDTSSTYETLNATLYSKADLIIDGNGSLQVSCPFGHAIKAKDTFTSKNGKVSLDAFEDGLHVNEDAVFENGDWTIKAGDEGVQTEMNLQVKNGTYSVESTGDALRAEDIVTIEGGTFHLATTEQEGIEGKNKVLISGGEVNIDAQDDAINAANDLEISGGTVFAASRNNDAIDSNGTLTISGGKVTALAKQAPEEPFDTDGTPFVISGGEIIGFGPMSNQPTQTDQPVLLVGGSGTIRSVQLLDASGKVVLEADNLEGYSSGSSNAVFFSSPKLKKGEKYTVKINGSELDTVSLDEDVTTVGNVQSMGGGRGGMGPGGDMGPGGQRGPRG